MFAPVAPGWRSIFVARERVHGGELLEEAVNVIGHTMSRRETGNVSLAGR